MKSVIIKPQSEESSEKFSPCIYIFKGGSLIVFIIKKSKTKGLYCGIALHSGEGREAGEYREDWILGNFEKFNGTLELSN